MYNHRQDWRDRKTDRARVEEMVEAWRDAEAVTDPQLFSEVSARLAEQLRCATQWRDQVNTYFLRKSGIADQHGGHIHP